jgi:hypothetical protein
MSSNAIMTGLGNVDPINYGEIDLQKIAETINKVIETAGYAFKGE